MKLQWFWNYTANAICAGGQAHPAELRWQKLGMEVLGQKYAEI